MILIIGKSNSGKSMFAEKLIMEFYQKEASLPLYYVATMAVADEAAKKRVEKHRKMRQDKPFITLEIASDLETLVFPEKGYVLLECLTNLVANEMFQAGLRGEELVQKVQQEIWCLEQNCKKLVLVAGAVAEQSPCYDEETNAYIKALEEINELFMKEAELVYQVTDGEGYVVE